MTKKALKIITVLIIFSAMFALTAFASGETTLNINIKNGAARYNGYIYIFSDTDNTAVYYTLDGTEPDKSSYLYTGNGILMPGEKIHLKAAAYKDGIKSSVCDFGEIVPENQNGIIIAKNRISPKNFTPSDAAVSDLEIINIEKTPKKVDIVLALYDGDKLCNAKRRRYTLSPGVNTVSTTQKFPENTSENLSARIYIFDSLENMNPYTDGYQTDVVSTEKCGLALPLRRLRSAAKVLQTENIALDGLQNEDGWKKAEFYTAGKISGKSYSTAKFKMLHDSEKLYIFASIADSSVYADKSDIKKSDRIILYFDGKDDNTAYYDENDSYVIITSDGRCEVSGALKDGGAEFKTVLSDSGWTAEAAIDLKCAGIDINGEKNPGFDFEFTDYYKDNDYSVNHIWRGSGRNIYSTAAFGEMVLE